MSLMKNIVFVFGTGLTVGMIFWNFFGTTFEGITNTQNRSLASDIKPIKLKFVAKPEKIFEVSVAAVGGIPENSEQELTLKGTIVLKQRVHGEIEYRWILPPEAQLVSGQLQDGWAELNVGEPIEVQITITGISRENASSVAIFHVENETGGIKIGNSAVFSPQAESIQINSNMKAQSHSENPEQTPRGLQF